ncbi:MAG: TetR family transcriptional regulator C-terminal domain-containing protein, partial [Thermohalobaculum sp.]|nr:TetR family transcriptional regulator C-terminal domain-containing protein [Thermohalobaculum sp.]
RKLEMARDYPRESRLFAGEIMRGAPLLGEVLRGPLKALVDEKVAVIEGWIAEGRLVAHDPRHLMFAIWATTQHYADFDVQVRAVLGDDGAGRFDDAAAFLERLFLDGLAPH